MVQCNHYHADNMHRSQKLWWINHGVDIWRIFPMKSSQRTTFNPNLSMAHFVLRDLSDLPNVKKEVLSPGNKLLSSRLFLKIAPLEILDSCLCKCTSVGCHPVTVLILQLYRAYSRSGVTRSSIADIASSISGFFQDLEIDPSISRVAYVASIQLLTFEALGLRHTCCRGWILPGMSSEEIEEIWDEEKETLNLLGDLMDEFDGRIRRSRIRFNDFLTSYWAPLMEHVLADLKKVKLGSEEIKKAEALGVTWWRPFDEGLKPEIEDKGKIEYWVRRLNEISPESTATS
ncbi:hypothetical protein F5B20DRAFT_561008 [Whalleya microplaca]|nr:hypothetical protein F5B20DRAFT_561008 [Whalleya microplaca]